MSETAPHASHYRRGLALSVGSVVLVSTNFVTVKYSLSPGGFQPKTFALLWTALATLYTGALVAGMRGRAAFALTRTTALPLLGIGLLTTASMGLQWTAMQTLDPTFASLLQRFLPCLGVLAGVVCFRETLKRPDLLAMALMIGGALLASWGKWEEGRFTKAAILYGLGLLAVTGQYVLAKGLAHRVSALTTTFYRLALAVPGLAVIVLLSGAGLELDVPLRFWLVMAAGALMGPCLSHLLLFRSYRYWPLTHASMMQNIQPLLVLGLAATLLGMVPDRQSLVGGLVILIGAGVLGLAALRSHRHETSLAAEVPASADLPED